MDLEHKARPGGNVLGDALWKHHGAATGHVSNQPIGRKVAIFISATAGRLDENEDVMDHASAPGPDLGRSYPAVFGEIRIDRDKLVRNIARGRDRIRLRNR